MIFKSYLVLLLEQTAFFLSPFCFTLFIFFAVVFIQFIIFSFRMKSLLMKSHVLITWDLLKILYIPCL